MEDTILKDLFSDQEGVLNEASQKVILEAFNAKVNEKAEEMFNERSVLALESMEKDHIGKLQQVVERYEGDKKIALKEQDVKYAEIVKETFEKVDTDRTQKINLVKEHYTNLLNESVKEQTNLLVMCLESFLDTWLDEHIPTELVAEAAKKDHSADLIKQISKLVTLDEKVDSDIREGMLDAKKTIEEQNAKIVELERSAFLKEKTASLPVLERNFVIENFEGKDLDFIERNFDYTRKLFSKGVVVEKTSTQNVDSKPVITEGVDTKEKNEREVQTNSAMAEWVNNAKGSGIYG